MSDTLFQAWGKLKRLSSVEAGIRVLRLPPDNFQLYAGWSVPNANPSLVLKIPTGQLPLDTEHPQSEGFLVAVIPEITGRDGLTRIVLELRDKQYEEVFMTMAQDVYEHMVLASTNIELTRSFYRQLHRWQAFLKKGRSCRLSRSEQIGLWGELNFLYRQLAPKIGIFDATKAWQGPVGGNQDFSFNGEAVEVKVTTSNPHEKIYVSNLKQLDPAGLVSLYLHHIAATEHQGCGETIATLVELIRAKLCLDGGSPESFDVKLFESGYLDSESVYYSEVGYTELRSETYLVGIDFPRIKAEDLPGPIGDVKYSLMLASCEMFKVDQYCC